MPGTPGQAAGGAWATDWRSIRRQQRLQRRAERHHDRNPALVFGLLLILVGGLLAWHQIDPHFDLGLTWPIVVIAFGALLIVTSIRPNRGSPS